MSERRPVAIRQLESADAEAAAALLDQLGYPATGGSLAGRIERIRALPHVHAVAAVLPPERLVGLATVHLLRLLTDDAPLALLTSLVVAADVRGHGIGRALVEHLAAYARENGARRMIVNTHVRRADAHTFYETMGFEFTGRRYARAL